jgi:hypothetical protein
VTGDVGDKGCEDNGGKIIAMVVGCDDNGKVVW